jgi:hypothetical protein
VLASTSNNLTDRPAPQQREYMSQSMSGVCVWRSVSERMAAQVTPRRKGMTSNSQTSPLIEEEAPRLNTYMSTREQKSWSWIPKSLKTKNYCAGMGQHQFNLAGRWPLKFRENPHALADI